MNKSYLQKGFTLIELLVVIAIIGILSSVVLASLSTARGKANDTKVKAQMASIRSQAEIIYSNNPPGKYGQFNIVPAALPCGVGTAGTIGNGLASILNGMPSGTTLKCGQDASRNTYAVAASISAGSTNEYWCVDSTGYNGSIVITTPANVVLADNTCALMDAR